MADLCLHHRPVGHLTHAASASPSQDFFLGSIPGLAQDFADIANTHAEYAYIPRLPKHLERGLQLRRPLAAHQHRQSQPQDQGINHSSRAAASATGDDERLAKISFSDNRSNQPSLISGTCKRSKQLIYAAADQNGDGAEEHGPARPRSAIQYLSC
ncbi:hypothetical protein PtB15_14B263 [Puccinia triticina]|nr:hypothetical protein PtB15_14B263 [Puccinia triticina]